MKKDKGKNKRKKANLKSKSKKSGVVRLPHKLLVPVGDFLRRSLKILEKRKRQIDKEDPFKDVSRLNDNASPDADAEEQFGHARTSAIKEEIDRKIIQTKKALSRIKLGKYGLCEDCGQMIDTDRLMIYPEATFCAKCKGKEKNIA